MQVGADQRRERHATKIAARFPCAPGKCLIRLRDPQIRVAHDDEIRNGIEDVFELAPRAHDFVDESRVLQRRGELPAGGVGSLDQVGSATGIGRHIGEHEQSQCTPASSEGHGDGLGPDRAVRPCLARQPLRRARVQGGAKGRIARRAPTIVGGSRWIRSRQAQSASRPLIDPHVCTRRTEQLPHLTAHVTERCGLAGFAHAGQRLERCGQAALEGDFTPQSRTFERQGEGGHGGSNRGFASIEDIEIVESCQQQRTACLGSEREGERMRGPEALVEVGPLSREVREPDRRAACRQLACQGVAHRRGEPAGARQFVQAGPGRGDEASRPSIGFQDDRNAPGGRVEQLTVQVRQEVCEPVGVGQEANRSGAGRLRHTRADFTLPGVSRPGEVATMNATDSRRPD